VNISSEAQYALTVRAATGAGFSPVGKVVLASVSGSKKKPTVAVSDPEDDQNVGKYLVT